MSDTVEASRNRALRALAALFGVIFATACVIVWLSGRDAGAPAGDGNAPIPDADDPVTLSDDGVIASTEPGTLAYVEFGDLSLPVLGGAGPTTFEQGLASGFGQCEAGAVLAAAHLVPRSLPQAGSDIFVPTIEQQFTGEWTDEYLEAVERTYAVLRMDSGAAEGDPAGEHAGGAVGYRIDNATEASVTLRLLIENPGADGGLQWASMLIVLTWIDGDWRVVAPTDGIWEGTLAVLESDAGYARWADLAPCEGGA
jgi:hypothetical protein